MLNYIKLTLNFLCYDFDKFAWLIAVSLLAVEVLVFLVALIVVLIKKSNSDASYFLIVSFLALISSVYFALEDYRLEKALFITFKSVYVYAIVFAIITSVFYLIIKKASTKKPLKIIETKPLSSENLPVSNTVKYFNKREILTDYLDVSYIRTLILELKQKSLSIEDYSQIEEFEIYLLRFISRQPNSEERVVLSNYLSMLIKKISLYA